jgi:PAS domain S-box-containing protein
MRVHLIEGPFSLIYGIEPEEMRIPTFAMFLRNIVPEDRPYPQAVREILAANGSWCGAYRVRGRDGRLRHMRHFAVRHAHDGATFISGLILDESAAADASAESSVFRLAVESSHEGFAITDTKGRYTYLNQEHGRLFGYQNAGELLGREWRILYGPAEVDFIQQRISLEVAMAGFWHGHVLAVRKDGSTFQQDLTLSLLPSCGMLCICRDRSEELQLNARLEGSEAMLRSLFDALPMGIIIRDEHGVRQFANGFILREGGSGAAMIPRADWAEGDKEWERRQCKADHEVLSTGRSCEYVVESGNAKQRRWFHCIVFLVQALTGVSRRIGSLIMDITRQKRLELETYNLSERRRELLEIQREFISMVSHEFRTPLTTIEGAQFLLEKLLNESANLKASVAGNARKWLNLQASALATLRKLVDQVLMLNRIEHMTGEASLERLSPADVLVETVARFNDSMDSPRVVLRNEVPISFTASMDSGLVKAAAENLVSNGLKYSGLDKPVHVRVYTEPEGWAVEVVDLGRGIPQEDQAKLFQPFFRASNVGTVPGTGLGLAIVQRAVDFHTGRVEFESSEDSGTSFRLHFPSSAHPPGDESAEPRLPIIGRAQSHE